MDFESINESTGAMDTSGMEFDSEDGYVVISDKDGRIEEWPSEKWGMVIMVPLIVGVILLTIGIAFVLFKCSQKQERHVANKRKAEQEEKEEQLKAGLSCKPWSTEDSGYTSATDGPDNTDNKLGEIPTFCESSSSSSEEDHDEENPTPSPRTSSSVRAEAVPNNDNQNVDCAVCSKSFVEGEDVYTSNNPGCCHQHHKACMDKWLEYQNTCPLCNQPFALKTA